LSQLIAIRSILAAALLVVPLAAQVAPAPTPSQTRAQAATVLGDSLQQLNATLDQLRSTLTGLSISRWKAPGGVRQTTQADVDSMQRDLGNTLPPLLTQARANAAQLAPVFSVYRNVDALYDVLLRVSETAQLAGAANDIQALEEQRALLESTRTRLGTALLNSAQAEDSEVTQLRTAAASSAAAPATASKTVVDDGPATRAKSAAKRTRKPASTATPPANNPPQ
jgi:hypothetical protein